MASKPFRAAKADYDAAVEAHKIKLTEITPAREIYDELYAQHRKLQEQLDKIAAQMDIQRTMYLRHKRYVVSLSNALLASNTALLSATSPWSHVQVLTQATLIHKLHHASRTLVDMIVHNKQLDEMKEASYRLDHESYKRCQFLFRGVDKDCREVDLLHGNVVDAEKNMGREPECGQAIGDCESCLRNKEREAERAKMLREAKEGGSKKAKGGMGKAAKGKQRLDDILEEEEAEDSANA